MTDEVDELIERLDSAAQRKPYRPNTRRFADSPCATWTTLNVRAEEHEAIASAPEALRTLQARIRELERDARRYRELRSRMVVTRVQKIMQQPAEHNEPYSVEVDATIDAVLEQEDGK